MIKENKKIYWSLGLLIVIYASLVGSYINTEFQGNPFLYASLDIIIYTFIAMLFPLIMRLKNNDKLDYKIGEKICMWNSIIIFFLSLIIKEEFNFFPIGGMGALIYFYINLWLFVDEKETDKDIIGVNNTLVCKNCGYVAEDNFTYCPECSTLLKENVNKEESKSISKDELTNLYKCGYENLKNHNYEEAEEQLKKYIEITEKLKNKQNDQWYTFNNSVEFILYTEENQETIDKKIIDINYNTSNAYLCLAYIDFERKNYNEAIKKIDNALIWNPYNLDAIFEKAENYKEIGNIKEYYNITLDSYEKIYTPTYLARYYRNLGYYFIEKEDYELAKALYLYSLKFEESNVVTHELKYINLKTNNNILPKYEELKDILKENRIQTNIKKEIIDVIKNLNDKIIDEKSENTEVGKYILELYTSIYTKIK